MATKTQVIIFITITYLQYSTCIYTRYWTWQLRFLRQMKTDIANRLLDPENILYIILKFYKKIRSKKKLQSPAGGYFDYQWKVENLIRSSQYSCETSHNKRPACCNIASFSVAYKKDNANRPTDPKNLHIIVCNKKYYVVTWWTV